MLPLLLGAGRMLAAGAARGAASGAATGGVRKAIAGGVKDSLKKGVVDGAKNKAKSFLKKKSSAIKKVSPQKLLPRSKKGGGGGGLVRRKSSAIVRRKTSSIVKLTPQNLTPEEKKKENKEEQKPFDGDELIKELTAIKETLIKIKGVLGSNLKNTLKNQKNQRILRSKEKASQREAELEKKPEAKGGIKLGLPKKDPSFLDMIWNFISNVLLGSLVNFLFTHSDKIFKMFDEIGKGFQNPLQQLRLGIITLTTLFPKQIKFLAKLTSKIIGPPARLIGKLLLKAGRVAGNLFKKAGGIIFNLIKGPLTSLVRKIGGEALEQGVKGAAKGAANLAGKAASGAGRALGSAGRLIKRFKAFSKIFKKVPVVGMLIGIGIDLALGEPLDRAIVGAVGAGFGAALGGAIGSAVIPIPVVGTAIGGFVGSGVGDWAAKKLYENLTGRMGPVDKANPIEAKASGGILGSVKSFFGFGGSKKSTPVKKPPVKASGVSVAVEEKAKDDVLKDEKSLDRFRTLSSIFGGTPFIGQLLKMGIDIGMGASIDKSQTDIAAQDIGYTIGKALEDEEFSVPGLNKRIIGPLTKNLTEWAKQKIFYEVKNREGLFPTIEKSKQEEKSKGPGGSAGGEDGEDGEVGAGPVVTGGSADFWAMVAVASLENSNPQGQADVAQVLYNRLASGKYSGKSIKALVLAPGQFQPTREGDAALWTAIKDKQSAIAAVNSNPNGRGRGAKMVESAAAAIQNVSLQKNAAQFVGGRTDFSATGQYRPYPGAIGIVTRHGHDIGWFVGPGSIAYGKTNPGPASAPRLGDIAVSAPRPSGGGGGGGGGSNEGGSDPGSLQASKKGKIYLHWNAAANNNPFGYQTRYHSIFTEDGKKHQKLPYSQFRTPEGHTAYRNSSGVGLAVAAMKDYNWSYRPKQRQLEAMAQEAANLAKAWGWNAGMVNVRNVATHAEVGSMKDGGRNSPPMKGATSNPDNYGPTYWGGDGERTDMHKLNPNDPDGSGGDKIRAMIKQKMGGMGGGNGFNHHALPPLAMGGGHTVTSSMGLRNFALSPGMHMGVDIAGRTGEPLQAFTDGVVEAAGNQGGYGNYVNWIDNKGIGHFYAHMNKPAFVKRGTRVKKGTILGELGSTGRSSGPHLHWEAATNPRDTGMSKSAVLSRFNPLSKYNKESPFGGSIKPDAAAAEAETGTPMQPSSPGSPGSPGSPEQSNEPITYASIPGDPASQEYIKSLQTSPFTQPKGGPMGGGLGSISSPRGIGGPGPASAKQFMKLGGGWVPVPEDSRGVVLGRGTEHGYPARDVPMPVGTPLLAPFDGKIQEINKNPGGWGNFLVMKGGSGVYSLFGHVSAYAKKQGDSIKSGEQVASSGHQHGGGRSTGPHLHWEIGSSWNGTIGSKVEPIAWTKGKATPSVSGQTSSNASSTDATSTSTSTDQSTSESPEQPIVYADIAGDPASEEYVKYIKSLPPQSLAPSSSTPSTPTTPPPAPILPPPTTAGANPPGALAPGQRPDKALNKEQFAAAQKARSEAKAAGLTGKQLEVYVANAVMGVPQNLPSQAVIAPQQSAPSVAQQSKNISSTPSYAQGGQPSILMMPLPSPSSSSGSGSASSSGGKPSVDSGELLNTSNECGLAAAFVLSNICHALYKR